MNKPAEFWIALAAASFYVFQRSSDRPLLNRLAMTTISAALGYSLTPELSAMTGRPEILTLVVLVTMLYLALDFASALFADRAFLVDAIKKVLGK